MLTHDGAIRRLQRLLTLPESWDRDGAPRIATVAVSRASELLDGLQDLTPGGIGPASDGGVHLEWHREPVHIEVDCYPDGRIEVAWFFGDVLVQEGVALTVPEMQCLVRTVLQTFVPLGRERSALQRRVQELEAENDRLREALRAARRCIRAHHRSGESLGDRLCGVCVADTTDYGYEYQPDRDAVERALAALEGGSDGQ